MIPIVLDASAVVPWFLSEPATPAAERLPLSGRPLLAPDFLLVEVANVMLTHRRRGNLAEGYVPRVLDALRRPGHIAFTETARLVEDAARLAERVSHPIYDCLYLALARREGAALASFDRRLSAIAQTLSIPLWASEGAAEDPV